VGVGAGGEDRDDRLRAQLGLLGELEALFAALRVRAWLRGGWALDFLLGKVTRPHADIDLVTWTRHRPRLHRALPARGFALERELPVQTDFTKEGQWVSVVFVARGRDGGVTTPGIPAWVWRPDALPRRKRTLAGRSWRVLGPEQLLYEKESHEAGTGRPPRPKDLASMALLRGLAADRRATLPPGSAPPRDA
jgi:Aminoglycoside-2''-adenylyltransferase